MLKLKPEIIDETICVSDMKDGDVAIITNWIACRDLYVGRIVQRYQNFLLTVGASSINGWGEYFSSTHDKSGCKVRLLKKGDTLVVE